MNLYKKVILCGAGVLAMSLASCEDYLNINTDPNTPTDETAQYYQRLGHIEFYQNGAQQFAAWRNCMACGDWTRYYNGGTYQSMSYMYPTVSISTTPYQWGFVGAYANVPIMIKKAREAGNHQYVGAGLLMKAYHFMLMTDLYGEMPYTEAVGSNPIPRYDNGRTIFMGCIADIDEAIKELEEGVNQSVALPNLANGDWYANGDINKWVKFAYLLKARWLLKLSAKGEGSYLDGKYDTQAILAALDKAQSSTADDVIINHTDANGSTHDVLGWDEPVDYSPLYSVCGMNAGYYVTNMLFQNLTNFGGFGIEDPRADHIIPWQVSKKSPGVDYEGMGVKWDAKEEWRRSIGIDMGSSIHGQGGPLRSLFGKNDINGYGWYVDSKSPARYNDTLFVEQTSESKGYAANVDLLYRRARGVEASRESGTFYTRVSSPTYVATYAEACFIRAEVLFNKGDRAGAFAAYKNGILASIEQMNNKLKVWINEDSNLAKCPSFVPMEQADIDNFINNGIGNSSNLTLGMIMTQKRIALQFSMEVWNDMRRYDYDPNIFLNYVFPAYHSLNEGALRAIPAGKSFRRWMQCSHETSYNASNLQAIGHEVPGANFGDNPDKPLNWFAQDDVWTIPVWWNSTQP